MDAYCCPQTRSKLTHVLAYPIGYVHIHMGIAALADTPIWCYEDIVFTPQGLSQ